METQETAIKSLVEMRKVWADALNHAKETNSTLDLDYDLQNGLCHYMYGVDVNILEEDDVLIRKHIEAECDKTGGSWYKNNSGVWDIQQTCDNIISLKLRVELIDILIERLS